MSQMPSQLLTLFILSLLLFLPARLLAADNYTQITHGRQRISIDYPVTFTDSERQTVHHWLQTVTGSLLTVYGELPKDHFRIHIERGSGGPGPVPWGQVKRHTPTEVLLVINPEQGYDKLVADWTAFHELSHLLLPYRGYGNVWLSEGLASYYQNLIQARSGRFDAAEMWHRIVAGFERGKQQQRWQQLTLTEVSNRMRETRQFMRIHWSGVLYWMTVDVELRKANKTTLDRALKQLKDCCAESDMSAEEIVQKLDELSGASIFVPLFHRYGKSLAMPDYSRLLGELGVVANDSGNIVYNNNAPLAEIRKQIASR